MTMYRYLGCVLAWVLVSAPLLASDEGIPEQRFKELKTATVYVKAEGKQGATIVRVSSSLCVSERSPDSSLHGSKRFR
jgi:hypothetical protein